MTSASGQWDDLVTRMVSGAAIAAVGLLLMYVGGIWFQFLCAAVAGVMVWELARMLGAGRAAFALAGLSAVAVLMSAHVPVWVLLALMATPAAAGFVMIRTHSWIYAAYTLLIMVAAVGLMIQRDDFGFRWIAWLVLVVAVSDVFGYFAGRKIGGPKLWPRVSPKKTWSGTVAGWIGAGCLGALFMIGSSVGPILIPISVAVAMAGQAGDIAESAVKRMTGVKDSSNLIPGHGGLFDRFDALLGASVFLLLLEQVIAFPPTGTG